MLKRELMFATCVLVTLCGTIVAAVEYPDNCMYTNISTDYAGKRFQFKNTVIENVPANAVDVLKNIQSFANVSFCTAYESPQHRPATRRVSEIIFIYYLVEVPKLLCRLLNSEQGKKYTDELTGLEQFEKSVKMELFYYSVWNDMTYSLRRIDSAKDLGISKRDGRFKTLKDLWYKIDDIAVDNFNQRFQLIWLYVKGLILRLPTLTKGERMMRQKQLDDLDLRRKAKLAAWRDKECKRAFLQIKWVQAEEKSPELGQDFTDLKIDHAREFEYFANEFFAEIEKIILLITEPEYYFADSFAQFSKGTAADPTQADYFIVETLATLHTRDLQPIINLSKRHYLETVIVDGRLRNAFQVAVNKFESETLGVIAPFIASQTQRIQVAIPYNLHKLAGQKLETIAEKMRNFSMVIFKDLYPMARQMMIQFSDRCDTLVQTVNSFKMVAPGILPPLFGPPSIMYLEPRWYQDPSIQANNFGALLQLERVYGDNIVFHIANIDQALRNLMSFSYTLKVATPESRSRLVYTQTVLQGTADELKSVLKLPVTSYSIPNFSVKLYDMVLALITEEQAKVQNMIRTQFRTSGRTVDVFDEIQKGFDESLRKLNMFCFDAIQTALSETRKVINKHFDGWRPF